MSPQLLIQVAPDQHGGWEVRVPNQPECHVCKTVEDARRWSYEYAKDAGPCELVVRDAYHRVMRHEPLGAS